MGGNAKFRQAQSVRVNQAKNLIDDFLKSAHSNKYPKVINANYMSTLLNATKKRDRKKIIATDNSARSNYTGNSEVLQKYAAARKAIINLSMNDLNKSFKNVWEFVQNSTK